MLGAVERLVGLHPLLAAGAAVQAARLVDAHASWASQRRGLDTRLATLEAGLRAMLQAGVLAVVALVEAEEQVVLEVRIHRADSRQSAPAGPQPGYFCARACSWVGWIRCPSSPACLTVPP